MKAEDIVVGLVALNDKELIGRTRLQKITYLLDRCGAEFGLPFEYYRYGPLFVRACGWSERCAGRRAHRGRRKAGTPQGALRSFQDGGGAAEDSREPPGRTGCFPAGAHEIRFGFRSGTCRHHCLPAGRVALLRQEQGYCRQHNKRSCKGNEAAQIAQGDAGTTRKGARLAGRIRPCGSAGPSRRPIAPHLTLPPTPPVETGRTARGCRRENRNRFPPKSNVTTGSWPG